MVFSVFAGTVAFAGTAAADVTTLSNASATDVGAGESSVTQTIAFNVTSDTADETVTITLGNGSIQSGGVSVTNTTGNITADNGNFQIIGLQEGTYDVVFDPSSEQYSDSTQTDVEVISGTETDLGTVQLESNSTL